jgi:hypothetical protein
MTTQSLAAYKFAASYGCFIPELNRREIPSESFERVIDMHRTKYKGFDIEAELKTCLEAMKAGLVLGSQRALQFGGSPILRKEARAFNCSGSYADRPRFFQECLYLLLCGCGTGFSVQLHHVAKLPKLIAVDKHQIKVFTVADSVEGWADALGVLLASYGCLGSGMNEFAEETAPGNDSQVSFQHPGCFSDYMGSHVSFDYSRIRNQGSSLSTGAGKAPGPGPLSASLEKIRGVLDAALTRCHGEDCRLRPIDVYDIIMHASDAVLAGGVRRSATICLFSVDDHEMMNAKTGNWMQDNPQRARSNNSAMLIRGETSWEAFHDIFMLARRQYGEPGFVWSDSTELMVNPCVETGMYPAISRKDLKEILNDPASRTQLLQDGRRLVDVDFNDGSTHAAIVNQDDELSGWAFCVGGDTLLMTEDGIHAIKDVVGKQIKIWNGTRWCVAKPFSTGSNRKLYRVELSDGSFLDCTEDHVWLVKDRFGKGYSEVPTGKLLQFSDHPIHVPRSGFQEQPGLDEPCAYEMGFLLGDGHTEPLHGKGRAKATLYGPKIDLPLDGKRGPRVRKPGYGVDSVDIVFDIDVGFATRLKRDPNALRDLHAWSSDSILSFIAGWADADGSQAGNGIRIYGTESRCRDAQLLLSRVGILCSVNLHNDAATNFGERTEASWYIQITECQKIPCHRLDTSKGYTPRCKGKHQIIRSVNFLGKGDTYCLEEPDTHCCVFNNVLTKQCNLCEVNAKACRTDKDWGLACTAAAILGTLQAGYTKFDYLGNVSECIAKREALLGVSMTGMMDNPTQSFDPQKQRALAQLILDVNAHLAPRLGIRPTARATCVKPAGSTSCLLGTSSGIHAQHAKRYFRRAQANINEAPFQYFKVHNPDAIERSVWEPNGNTAVITFCIEASDEALTRREVNGLKQLEYVKLTQDNWVAAGSVPARAVKPWLHHNVSNTITIRQTQEEAAARYIYDNRESFTGVSILGTSGDLDYPQAPFCEVRTESEILERYGRGAFFASGLIVDGLHAFGNNLWLACDTVMGLGEAAVLANGVPYPGDPDALPDAIREAYEHVHELKKDWIRRARKFAENYFQCPVEMTYERKADRDAALKQMTYCLKEVNNLHLWERLTRSWRDVDYSLMVEEHDGTKGTQPEMACAGGACTLQHA